MIRYLPAFAFVIWSLGLTTSIVRAQEEPRGSITGRVIDKETRQPIIGATISIPETKYGARTNAEGLYHIKDLPENVYKLRISSLGHIAFLKTDVRVVRFKSTQVEDITLQETRVEGDTVLVSTGLELDDPIRPVSNYTYSEAEIRRAPGAAGDIFRAIETLPGVSGSGGEFSSFSVRGGSPLENIVLVDNIPVDKTSHMEGGSEAQESQGGRFSIFATGIIDQANFQGGGFGARYGGKNASLVELKIKEGDQEDITADVRYDLLGLEANYNGPTFGLPSTSMMLSLRHNDFKNVLKLTGQEELGYPWFTDVIVKTTTKIDERNKLSILGIYTTEFFERTMDHVMMSKDFAGTDLYFVDRSQQVAGINWHALIGDESFGQFTAYYRANDWLARAGRAMLDERKIVGGKLTSPLVARDSIYGWHDIDKEFGVKADLSFGLSSSVLLNVGAAASQLGLDITRSQRGFDTVYTFATGDLPDPEQKFLVRDPRFRNETFSFDALNTAAYAEAGLDVSEQLTVTPGVRWEYSDLNKKQYFSPRLSANYKLSSESSVSFGTGIYYQLPEISTFNASAANRELESERAIHAILSFKTLVADGLRLSIEPYYKTFSDLLVRKNRASYEYANLGDGYAVGIDFGLIKRLDDQLYGQLNYSYAISKRRDAAEKPYYDSDFNQPHVVNLLVGYELDKNWQFSAKFKYATGRPADAYIIHKNVHGDSGLYRYSQEITGNNADRTADFHTLNVRADRRIQIRSLAIVLFLDILNVYGNLNVNEERFLETNGIVEERGFRIIPTFGLKIEI